MGNKYSSNKSPNPNPNPDPIPNSNPNPIPGDEANKKKAAGKKPLRILKNNRVVYISFINSNKQLYKQTNVFLIE